VLELFSAMDSTLLQSDGVSTIPRAIHFSHGARLRESRHGGEGDDEGGQSSLTGIPSAVLGLFVAGNLLVVVMGLLALFGAGVLEALTRRRA